MNISWKKFIEKKLENPEPQRLLVEALMYVSEKGAALDIGAGPLIDTQHLLDEGFKAVVAIDPDPAATVLAEGVSDRRFQFSADTVENCTFPENHFDIISAQYVFPYMQKKEIEKVFALVEKTLKKGGVFAGQLFGVRDSWNVEGDYRTYFTRDEVEKLLTPFEILVLREEEKDTTSRLGKAKHAHFFEFIVRK